jgi:hypothetical protein
MPTRSLYTAAEAVNDRVMPFYDEHGIRLCRALTDRGTKFCGDESHEYELTGTLLGETFGVGRRY